MSGVRPRLLVLDDDTMIRRALQRIALYRTDITLETVGTPAEVLERIGADPSAFDLVVCDYRLEIDGQKLNSSALVAELRARGVPVAVMSGHVEQSMEVLGVPLVEKPIRIDDLIALAST